jgi:excisionase family DNA binding protein
LLPTQANRLADVLAQLVSLVVTDQQAPRLPQVEVTPDRVLLTIEEAGKRLNIGKTKMYQLVMSGQIESVLIGRLRRIRAEAITEYATRLAAEQSVTRPIVQGA